MKKHHKHEHEENMKNLAKHFGVEGGHPSTHEGVEEIEKHFGVHEHKKKHHKEE